MTADRYEFTDEDLDLVEQVHRLIVTHPERFEATGRMLDQEYAPLKLAQRYPPAVDAETRSAIYANAMTRTEADLDQARLLRIAKDLGSHDAAVAYLLHEPIFMHAEPAQDWTPRGRRLSLAVRDLHDHELGVETPVPGWDWAARVLLLFWLIVEPRADDQPPTLTDFQQWKWSWDPPDDLYPDETHAPFTPRSMMPFGISYWPTLLRETRRALRVASRLGLVPASGTPLLVEGSELSDLPLLSPSEEAAHRVLIDQSPMVPLTSIRVAELASKLVPLSDDVFRKTGVPKLKRLGLQSHPQYGYYYPFGCLARRLDAMQRAAQRSH